MSYEWKHGKGLMVFDKQMIETDQWGYYDKKLLDYYPKPKEYQYIDDYPFEDALMTIPSYLPNEWDEVDENFILVKNQNIKSPQEFEKEVEELSKKFSNPQSPDMWDNNMKKEH